MRRGAALRKLTTGRFARELDPEKVRRRRAWNQSSA